MHRSETYNFLPDFFFLLFVVVVVVVAVVFLSLWEMGSRFAFKVFKKCVGGHDFDVKKKLFD